MKNALLVLGLLSSMLALSSCEKNDSVPDNSCTIWINGRDKSDNKSICEFRTHALTAAQVCRLDGIRLVGETPDGVRGTAIECQINSDNENFANIDTINNMIGLKALHVSAALTTRFLSVIISGLFADTIIRTRNMTRSPTFPIPHVSQRLTR